MTDLVEATLELAGPLCPFRKDVFVEADSNGVIFGQAEDFLPCYQEKCAMWVVPVPLGEFRQGEQGMEEKKSPGCCGFRRGIK